ncbi:GNAT family N-acetyltransferase [Paractinoplanes atraurantiacus]|uniref:N-acetylglutamate synthase, GNAT family n=1 Tax=Paractinoplanes atraurantiacus TaxID=1036182 RepID=A0A285JFM1_9ACTN|nr:GNAT family N-acetyltransferase [Actinoplanes atraurantiacus]SNY59045.1 N-acetylglutamate synthase, GNAT family [Actinoplanes atraurantiacus]
MDVRLARTTDVADVRRLVDLAFTRYIARIGRRPMPMDNDYADLVERGRCWVAVDAGRAVGMVQLLVADDHLEVETLAVEPQAQGAGVGRRLLTFAEEQARAHGLAEVRLCTNRAMTENLSYYPRRGFHETHRERRQGFDRVFFAKSLAATLFTDVRIQGPNGTEVTDLRVAAGVVGGAGPEGERIDGTGLALVPVVPGPEGHVIGLVEPGMPADLLLVPQRIAPQPGTRWRRVVIGRYDVRALLSQGRLVVRDGDPLARPSDPGGERTGVWIDQNDWLHQELMANGRYDETRGGRRHAYTGRYWLDRDRIDYLDDSGFYAFGEFIGDTLHHVDFVMRRR